VTGAEAAVAAAIAQAIKASGAIVRVEPEDFLRILARQDAPLVVWAGGRVFRSRFQYLTAYKGLVFYAKSAAPLYLPDKTETIQAKKILTPS
jgi:hypothetical protein